MRAMRFGIGVLVIAVLFAVFALTSRPRTELPSMRPYVTTQDSSYAMEDGEPRMHLWMRTHDLLDTEAHRIMDSEGRGAYSTVYISEAATVGTPKSNRVQSIEYWRELGWNEVLWLRLTHFGRNPFDPESEERLHRKQALWELENSGGLE